MTIKTLTTALLLAASFLLLTACNSKSDSETNTTAEQNPTTEIDTNGITETSTDTGGTDDGTSSDGGGDNNATVGGTDGNTTAGTGSGDDNTTSTPAITLTSLTLTINKTLLNKDESTTVKVMATYSDNTTKEMTDKVEWAVTPSDAVKVTNTTLTALQDKATTVKAKINTVASDTVNLNITWTVNGHTLPPEPDKATNDSTLLGIDVNNNDVRDDVERWIYETYKDKHPIHIDIAMQAGRAYKKVLETPERAKEIHDEVNAPYFCGAYYQRDAKYLKEPILIYERIDAPVKSKYFNTKARNNVYWQYDTLLSGGVYDIPWPSEQKAMCDFNTSKYAE